MRANTVAAEWAFHIREEAPHAVEVTCIEDEALEVQPLALMKHFDPAMNDALRGEPIR
jgi:hypothetical protein